MSMRYQAGILTASYFPLKTPSAPTIGAATQASATSVSVTFTAPTDIGGGAISSYTVVSSPGNIIATGTSSPITVTGLTTGTAYSFRVFANNAFGNSPASASSNVVTPVVVGQQAYTSPGSYTWVAPAGVTSVSVVAIGGGGAGGSRLRDGSSTVANGGGGGGLGYRNNIAVVPGNSYQVYVGTGGDGAISPTPGGEFSFFINTSTVLGDGGFPGRLGGAGGGFAGSGGGNGGTGGNFNNTSSSGGGGGAGGYSGNGGDGGNGNNGNGSAGSGGAGGGGGGWNSSANFGAGAGGGVGILGQGTSGSGGAGGANAGGGGGGSGGTNGDAGNQSGNGSQGGFFGGGGSGCNRSNGNGGGGSSGAVRIIWPGTTRQFPSTNTGDM